MTGTEYMWGLIKRLNHDISNVAPKKKYWLLLKSYCDYPDYEARVEADNKDEAIELFLKNPALREFDREMIEDKVVEETPCGDN